MKNYLITGAAIILLLVLASVFSNQTISSSFSSSTANLPEAKPTETVTLKKGESINVTAEPVKKTIAGNEVRMLSYNGSVPGPTIKVEQGSEITLNLTNKLELDTTLHPHGLRVDNQFDGVPGVTQEPIKIGDTFQYKLKFPDPGIYWYHPHLRQDYTQDMGLYGAFVVTPKDQNYWPKVAKEEVLMVDDILVENNKIAVYDKDEVDHVLMGRYGNTMLTNGSTEYTTTAAAGETVRYYINNAANTRTFNLTIPGAKIKLIGSDNGRYEKEEFKDNVILSPSERAIIDVMYENPGTYTLTHVTPSRTYPLGKIEVGNKSNNYFGATFNKLRENKDIQNAIKPISKWINAPADKQLKLSMDMMSGMNMGHGHGQATKIEWEDNMNPMNLTSTADNTSWKMIDTTTGKVNMDVDWKFKVGDMVKIRIHNDPASHHPMQHPIHFHGQRFVVLSTNDTPNTNLAWKDTALVQSGDTIDILVEMSNPGNWMAHCHISEHPEGGMMIPFTVEK